MVDSIDRKGSLHIPSTGDIRIAGVTPDAIRPWAGIGVATP